ncbi:MAG: NnrU protein [Rhodospirillales bacterium]|nr:NnrU protein [Rhodospirillales bacterium]
MGSLGMLAAAVAVFVVSHLALSAAPLRGSAVARIGEWPFRILYSTVSLALFGWMFAAFAAAPRLDLWSPPSILRLLAAAIVLFAFVLAVAGATASNPTAVGQERAMAAPPSGILAVTRHPMMWGIVLWGIAHLLANGDARGMIVFAGMIILAVVGMAHLEARKKAAMGATWDAFAARTSVWPFAAVVAGRARLSIAGIGWSRIGLALAVYVGLLYAHRILFGVAPIPWFSA